MMGLWLAATFPGDILGGWLGGFWSSMEKPHFFLMIAAIAALAGAAIFALTPVLKRAFEEREVRMQLSIKPALTSKVYDVDDFARRAGAVITATAGPTACPSCRRPRTRSRPASTGR